MTVPRRVLVIGMDALTPTLVEKWVDEGRLPTLGRFLDEGAWGRLRSVPNRNSAPAWSSMVTGLNPGKHGVFYWTDEDPTSYGFRFINGSFRRGEAVWDVLSEERKRVAIMNVPLSFPAEKVNGAFVSGLDSPSVEDPRFTYPQDLATELQRVTGGKYQVHSGHAVLADPRRRDEGVDRLHSSIDARATAAKHLLQSEEWDFFMVVFTESDVVQHFFWRQMEDPSSDDPEHHRTAVRDVYEHLDRVAAELIDMVDEDTLVMVVSDHGARADDGLARSLPSWLEQLGYLSYRKGGGNPVGRVTRRLLAGLYHAADSLLSGEMKHRLAGRFPALRNRVEATLSYSKIEWSKTRAYTDGKRPEVWLNLKGRQPEGIVKAERYDEEVSRLSELLTSAVCVGSGKPVVTAVHRRDAVYDGPFVDRSPDLVIEWAEEDACLQLTYPDGTTIDLSKEHLEDDPMNQAINGGHAQYGVLGFLGPGSTQVRFPDCDITDFTPTVLHLLGAPIPKNVDGRVLLEALDEELRSRSPRFRDPADGKQDGDSTGFSEAEEAEIHDRLKSLGYVE